MELFLKLGQSIFMSGNLVTIVRASTSSRGLVLVAGTHLLFVLKSLRSLLFVGGERYPESSSALPTHSDPPFSSPIAICVSERICLRIEFLLKTDSGYPKDTGVTLFTLATPGNPLRYNTHRSAEPVSALAHSRGLGAASARQLWRRSRATHSTPEYIRIFDLLCPFSTFPVITRPQPTSAGYLVINSRLQPAVTVFCLNKMISAGRYPLCLQKCDFSVFKAIFFGKSPLHPAEVRFFYKSGHHPAPSDLFAALFFSYKIANF